VGEGITLPHDLIQDRIKLVVHLLISEANDGMAALLQVSCAGLVVFGLGCMTIAINLNHELVRDTTKIRDIAPDGMLAAELEAAQLLAPQFGPELALGGCLVSTQFSGSSLDGLCCAPAFMMSHLLSNLSPPQSPPLAGGRVGVGALPPLPGGGRLGWGRSSGATCPAHRFVLSIVGIGAKVKRRRPPSVPLWPSHITANQEDELNTIRQILRFVVISGYTTACNNSNSQSRRTTSGEAAPHDFW